MTHGDQSGGSPGRFLCQTRPGRSVEVLTAGPADGLPLVFHAGTPSGLVPYQPMVDVAAARGLRLIRYGRPGYGASGAQRGRLVADAAFDVGAVLDHIGAERCVTVGTSGGGPHALATAALLPGRCLAAATVAGVAPRSAEGLDWLAGMAPENVAEFGAAMDGEPALTSFLEAAARELAEVTGEQVAASLGTLASRADRGVLTGEFAAFLAESFRAAVRTGIAGWRDDDLAFAAGWGFSIDAIAVPVSVWQGDDDMMVPFAHGQWLARQIPGAIAHLLPGEGHLTIAETMLGDVLDELVALAGRR